MLGRETMASDGTALSGPEHIVQAAIRVLARQGYARTSLLDIAREASLSKGALHYHFPSKESLIADVLQTACDAVAKRTLKLWQPSDNPLHSLRSALEELWRSRAARSDEALVVADLLAQSLYDSRLQPKLAEYYALAASQVQEHVMQHVLDIGLKPKVPVTVLSRLLIGLLDGLVMQVFVDPDVLSSDEVIDAVEVLAVSIFEFDPDAG